jgi:hypothetical protein
MMLRAEFPEHMKSTFTTLFAINPYPFCQRTRLSPAAFEKSNLF